MGTAPVRLQAIQILDSQGAEVSAAQAGETIVIAVTARFNKRVSRPMIGMLIRNRLGVEVFGTNTRIEGIDLGDFNAGDTITVRFSFHCFLSRQEYTLTVATQHSTGASQDWLDDAMLFTVVDARDTAGVASFHTHVDWNVARAS